MESLSFSKEGECSKDMIKQISDQSIRYDLEGCSCHTNTNHIRRDNLIRGFDMHHALVMRLKALE